MKLIMIRIAASKNFGYHYRIEGVEMLFRTFQISLIFILAGCASVQNKAIMNEEKSAATKGVSFAVANAQAQLILDKNNNILRICKLGERCFGAKDAANEIILLSKEGIGLGPEYKTELAYCGKMLMWQDINKNKYNDDQRACHSRFYTADRLMNARIFGGILTLGLLPIAMGSAYEMNFDLNVLKDATYDAHLQDMQIALFSRTWKYFSIDSKRTSIIYFDTDNLDEAYKAIVKDPVDTESVVLIDQSSKVPLYAFTFNSFKSDLPSTVNFQLVDWLATLSSNATNVESASGVDVSKLIPPEVPLPTLPSTKMERGIGESTPEFEKRVRERENEIFKIRQQYSQAVNDRNLYVQALSVDWQNHLEGKANSQRDMASKLRVNQAKLASFLFALNLGKLTASKFESDADKDILAFTATSSRFGFKQKLVAEKVPHALFKSIIEAKNYALLPKYIVDGNQVKLDTITLEETGSENLLQGAITTLTKSKLFETKFTDKSFKQDALVAVITNGNLPTNNTGAGAIFKSYEQKPQFLTDTGSLGIQYMATVKTMNARAPDWYKSPPVIAEFYVATGRGLSETEARLSAENELASSIKVRISSQIDVKTGSNGLQGFNEASQRIKSSVEEELKGVEPCRPNSKEEIDGYFYSCRMIKRPSKI